MSTKQRLTDLRQQLERWRSHNEVYAKAADKMLYELLDEMLKLFGDVLIDPETIPDNESNQIPQVQSMASDPPSEGGNSPSGTPDLP